MTLSTSIQSKSRIPFPPSSHTCFAGGKTQKKAPRKEPHHLETIYWTFATRYQLNTELSILCLHPNSRDRLHFITLRGGNVTGLGKAHAVLEVVLAFCLRINHQKMSLPLKCPTALALLAGSPEERKPAQRGERRPYWKRAEMCGHDWKKREKKKS